MFGHQLVSLCDRMIEVGLVDSREAFATRYCNKARGYLGDLTRREGPAARIPPRTVGRIRHRLAEVAVVRPDLAVETRALDAFIGRSLYVADLLGRRGAR